jgi:hypothetical protein
MDYNPGAAAVRGQGLKAAVMTLLLICNPASLQAAEGAEPKMLSGISVVGNNEAPKSLFIVPWKSSEIGFETNLNAGLMDDSLRPVDRDVFMREIYFYEIRHAQ